jgi:hypothetical protein
MRRVLMAALVSAVLSGVVLAQAPPPMPKPGPEHKRLTYYVGTWKGEGDAKASAFGPAGKFSFTEHNEWLPGGFFLVSHTEGKGPMGEIKGLAVMGYNTSDKVYTYQAYNSMGMSESAKGAVAGDTWTWTAESKMGGKPMKMKFTIKETSPTAYSFKFESSPDGKTWSTIEEGKATKTK